MMKSKQTALYFLDQALSILAVAVALFWSSGRFDWWPVWGIIAVWLVWFGAVDIVLLRINPDLLAERIAPPKGAKTWDKIILSSIRLIQLARYILAGLDLRYGWTQNFPPAAQIAGLVVCLLATAVFAWAMASNAYFSQVVRIQSDRGHTVVTGGPYRYVRHPSYAGMLLFELSLSTLLASWWAILAGGVCAVLFVVRTALEDRTLQAELEGYADYARRVRYRLLPGVW